MHQETVELHETSLSGPTILVFGNEGQGMRPPVARACDQHIKVPNWGDQQNLDSLNVSVAAGIILHHFCKQRV